MLQSSRELPPGPRLPSVAQAVRYTFDQPGFFATARERYGDTWTLRLPGFSRVVITRDRDAVARLFTADPLSLGHGNEILRPLFGDRSLMLLAPEEHLARRRVELPSFHGEAVRGYTERIRELADAEVAGWRAGEVVASHPRAREFTLAVILELVLGVRDRALSRELAEIFDAFDTPLSNLGQFMPAAMVRRSRWNLPARPFHSRMDRLRSLLSGHIAAARSDPHAADRRDVLAVLVQARAEDGSGMTDEDLRDDLITLVLAGHETTGTAIAWACDLLAHNPAAAGRLRETLAAGDRGYLKATAKEVLRARTAVYVSAGRIVREPFPVGRWVLEPGMLVLVDAQGIHGDERVHPDPLAFRPERFLDGGAPQYGYVPFGGGAHRCLGSALATLELELFLEAVAHRGRLVPAGPPARPKRRGIALVPAGGGRVAVAAG